jgi:hypothetical protein
MKRRVFGCLEILHHITQLIQILRITYPSQSPIVDSSAITHIIIGLMSAFKLCSLRIVHQLKAAFGQLIMHLDVVALH